MGKSWAWVTSALNEQMVENAIVLAGSLRRVKTAGKLVVITSSLVPEKARLRLYSHFDLVSVNSEDSISEEHAKVFAFSLSLFQGCVYLSPNSLVLKRCDEVILPCFDPAGFFLALSCDELSNRSSSIFTFVPSVKHFHALGILLKDTTMESAIGNRDIFAELVGEYVDNNHLKLDIVDSCKFYKLKVKEDQLFDGCFNELGIINFGCINPMKTSSISTGLIESYTMDLWWNIYHGEICRENRFTHPSQTDMPFNNSNTPEPVAIIGVSCRLPGANTLDELWQMLVEGREGIKQVPSHRWQTGHTVVTASTAFRKTMGGFLDFPIDAFDAKFFNISQKEAVFLDPQQRLLHEVTWEALEDAAIDPLSLRGEHVGVFVGSWIHDYKDIAVKSPDKDFFRIYMGNSIAAQAARLSFLYGITGPSIATESGCSSAICSVDMACKSLRTGETNLAMAAGVNLFLHPFDHTKISFVLAPNGRCKTFDEKADGFGRAEGVGALILKRLSDAINDGDKIWALIRGTAISQEGVSKSLGTPTVHCQSLAMELALKDAHVKAKDVSFLEAHGTATRLGDPVEIAAITNVYSKDRSASSPLIIGSVKTNLGHTEAVSGITGVIKIILQMQNETIVPHLNFSKLNPEIDLDAIPAKLPLSTLVWPRNFSGKSRRAAASSFGISGTNGHVIIEEAPVTTTFPGIDLKLERPVHIMKITAKTNEALDQMLTSYKKLLEESSIGDDKIGLQPFSDICYTANVGRATFNHRAVIVARKSKDAVNIISGATYMRREVQSGLEGKLVCFLFTGTGSQYQNMARELYLTSPVFRLAFDKCDHLLETRHGMRISGVLWDNNLFPDGSSRRENCMLDRTLYSQVAIFVVEYALLRTWESWGIKADFALGHSLGEFAAAICCGILSLESALELVVQRCKLIDCLPEGKMLVLNVGQSGTEQLLHAFQTTRKQDISIAAINSSEQTVLAGDSELIDRFAEFCGGQQVKCVVLAATHAFHSSHMDSILKEYRKIVETVIQQENRLLKLKKKTNCQFISGMKGQLITELANILTSEYWVRHTREQVNFLDASKSAIEQGCQVFLEIGPRPVLSEFVMKNNISSGNEIICLPSLRKNQNDWEVMLESLGKLFLSDLCKVSIDWKGFDQYYKRSKVSLPFYPFQRKKIWVDFQSKPAYIHPLVGHMIRNSSKSTVAIFENDISIRILSYLNEHAIGNTIIFPGAAFLEMCVVAGHCAVQGLEDEFFRPRRPIILKGFQILAPLALHDGKTCRLQTVIELNDSEKDDNAGGLGYSVKVSHWFRDNCNAIDGNESSMSSLGGEWKTHASACFLPMVLDESKYSLAHVDITEILEKWEKLSITKEMYEKLPEVGLHFGSTFQSLVCGWKQEGDNESDHDGILFEVKVPVANDLNAYLIHPVILDALLQASMLFSNKDRINKKLHVPVYIREFVWLSDGDGVSNERFVFCKTTKCKSGGGVPETTALLLDGSGSILASMNGIEFWETTVKLVESVLQQQSSAMPQLWEEIWKPMKGPLHGRANPVRIEGNVPNNYVSDEIMETSAKLNKLDDEELMIYHHLDDLTLLYFLNALYKLGWQPYVGQKIVLGDLMANLGIIDTAWNFMRYFFTELALDGIVQVLTNEKEHYIGKIIKLPSSEKVIEQLCLQTVVEAERSRGDYRIISEMGQCLTDFLTGKSSPLNTLFPEDVSKPNLGDFYTIIRPWLAKTGEILNNVMTSSNNIYAEINRDSAILRVLEVGSGTGSGTRDYLKFVESNQIKFSYTFTDISAAFFINAEVQFDKYKEHMQFKTFNIEEDPLSQGFTPEYYDIIFACEVIHATRDIRETLRNLRMLLKTGGNIQITETTKPDRRITLLVGLLEGYWRMTDHDLRPSHATISGPQWVNVLGSTGYTLATSLGCYNDVHSCIFAFAAEDYSIEVGNKNVFDQVNQNQDIRGSSIVGVKRAQYVWLIFCDGSYISAEIQRRLKRLNRIVVVIDKSANYYRKENFDPAMGKQEIANLLKTLEGDTFEGIIYSWALSPGPLDDQEQFSLPFLHLCQGLLELNRVTPRIYALTSGAFLCYEDSKCSNPAASTIWGMAKTLRNEQSDISMHCLDLPANYSADNDNMLNHVFYELFWTNDAEELIAFRDGKRIAPRLTSLKIVNEALTLPTFCDRFQLILPATKAISDLEFGLLNNYSLDEDEIEVQIQCCALNFRDIFAVLKPIAQFDKVNSIGSDFAGIVTKVGSLVTKWKIGDPVFGMNTAQQALPSHVATKENMVIRVPDNFTFAEAATIPAAFATALYCLVTVAKIKQDDFVLIHTASGGVGLSSIQIANHFGATIIATAGSRRKRAYLRSLGIQYVYHSRNTDYGDKILQDTNGRGVDLVLNSLTGPGFVEASIKACAKQARFVEMSKLNIWKTEQVHELRQDIDYTVADLTALEEKDWKELLDEMMSCINKNFVRPIPFCRFDAVNIRQAMGYLQKAKHIGKVVCIMPEMDVKNIQGRKFPKTYLFNDRSTYVISGGVGGIGFEVAKFMLNSGANNLILISRNAPRSEVKALMKTWNDNGKRVEAWQVDVGDNNQVQKMLEQMETMKWPQLRGIMHAAGVLSDGTIPNQSWEKFQTTYNAKVTGTLNLHNLTKKHRLEHFVLFSSVTSLFGSPGQINHSSANLFQDAFAHYRHSMGLPATTINFANWGEVGVATEIDLPGIRPIATTQGLRSIEAILKSNRLQTCVMNVESFGMVVTLFPKVKTYLDDKRLFGDVKAPTLMINTDQFWAEVDQSESRESKIHVFKRHIKNMLKNMLKMDPDENIDDNAEFQGLGVDSLLLIEIRNYMGNLLGSRLTLTAAHLKDCNSTSTLATRLVSMLEKKTEHSSGNEGKEETLTKESSVIENEGNDVTCTS